MEELARLEKEVASLRALLMKKEAECDALREKLMVGHKQSIQNMEDHISQNITLENCTREPDTVALPPALIGDTLSKWAIQRYSRQILLPQISVDGQKKLCAARVLVVGAGGLGCPAAMYLATAGVGTLGLVDYDVVEESNLHRQTLHTEQNCGRTKVDSAADTLHRLNSHVTIKKHHLQLSSANALQVLSGYDIVLDCTDNMPTRYLLNDACIMLKIPLVSGSALKMEGQLTIYGYRSLDTDNETDVGPCYRCLFPRPPPPDTVGSCAALGVLGPVTAVIGALQALEAINLIVRRPRADLLVSKMLLFDGDDCSFRCVKLRSKNSECSQCSEQAVRELVDYEEFCQARAQEKDLDLKILPPEHRITATELASKIHNECHLLVDVRSNQEFGMCRIEGAINFAVDHLRDENKLRKLLEAVKNCKEVTFVCRRGNDSQMVTKRVLEAIGDVQVRVQDLAGGLHAWAKHVDDQFPVY